MNHCLEFVLKILNSLIQYIAILFLYVRFILIAKIKYFEFFSILIKLEF